MKDSLGKALRVLAVVLLALTALMNILGGVGTTCAAFLTERFPSLAGLVDYRWLYQLLVVVTLALGVAGVWATIVLARGRRGAYRQALIVLGAGVLIGGVHVAASLALRGKAVPADMKLYANLFTLLVFLLLGLPGLRQRVGFDRAGGPAARATGGLAAIAAGALVLTVTLWAGPSHSIEGVNWTHVLRTPLLATGGGLLAGGGAWMLWSLALRQDGARADRRVALLSLPGG
jgi:heme/copper-type cytochrome/quinol oxidase subunit 3